MHDGGTMAKKKRGARRRTLPNGGVVIVHKLTNAKRGSKAWTAVYHGPRGGVGLINRDGTRGGAHRSLHKNNRFASEDAAKRAGGRFATRGKKKGY